MKLIGIALLVLSLVSLALADEDVVTTVHGTITKIDKTAQTVSVKTVDGTDHLFHVTEKTTVHGVRASDAAAEDSWHGLKEGSEVVAHSVKHGTDETAVEVDKVGKGGLKKTEGTVMAIDRGGKKLVIEGADGTEHTFALTGHAAADGGKDIAEGTEKGAKVAVYSTERAGKAVAHFFEKV